MKKFKELNINEQHREKGRFKPTTPHNVANVAAASPRTSSDSAEVRLKEAATGDTSNFETPVGNQFRQGDSPAARSMTEKPQKEPMKKYKEKVNEMIKPKMSALDKFRQASAERAKKHDTIEKEMQARHAAGKEDMSGSIDRLEKSLNREEVEQIDEAPVVIKTNKQIGARVTSIGPGGKETVIKSEPPFEGPYTKVKKTITDKSGAKHSPMSRAKDLARKALSKQSKALKPVVKEEKDDSRKAEIVKNVMKSAKKKKSESTSAEKFEAEPVLSSDVQKQ